MKEEYRCPHCNKLLVTGELKRIELVCPRCKHKIIFTSEK